MSLLSNIRTQITQNIPLQISPLLQKLPSLNPTITPTTIFPHIQSINEVQSLQPELVYVSLTIQDIQDQEYYYSYLIKKDIKKGQIDKIKILKYGFNANDIETINMDDYQHVMESREVLICVGGFYQSQWVQCEAKGQVDFKQKVIMKVNGQHQFRLGERINAVCVWNPFDKNLIFIRMATTDQIIQHKLSYQHLLTSQKTSFKKTRQHLLTHLQQFTTTPQSHLLLYSLISVQPFFINSNYNFTEILKQILPNVCHLKLKVPFKQCLFPYKNSDGILVNTPMQLGNEKTYVIIDFGEFSQSQEVKIQQEEIDNLKALKIFVEEGKSIYKWEYGESLVDHVHSGLIVKGSKLITPHFSIAPHLMYPSPPTTNFSPLSAQTKNNFRIYLQKCQKISPALSEESRVKIQKDVKLNLEKYTVNQMMLQERMLLAKLNAMTYGREQITYEDYDLAGELLGVNENQQKQKSEGMRKNKKEGVENMQINIKQNGEKDG